MTSRRARTTPREPGSRNRPPVKRGGSTAAGIGALVAVVVAVVALVAAAVLLVARDDDEDPTLDSGEVPSGMAHVHGLGVDPGDGQLYAGTHYGLFRVPDNGRAEPIAGRVQDFMGFTVLGPDHYLASGHPGAGQDAPGNLGLIETTDGGDSWQTLSLEGEADFHALEARHGRVYGWNAGRFMVSEDKETWDQRAELLLADFAVSPDDPDTIVVTTQQGVGISTDGGRRFSGLRGAPLLQLVTWTDGGTIVGADPRGGVHVSDDGGQTWEQRGSVDAQPAALTATDEEIYVATADGTISVSSDRGSSFQARYRES